MRGRGVFLGGLSVIAEFLVKQSFLSAHIYVHCMNDVYGALESVAVLWRLRSYRDIIIIIIIITSRCLFVVAICHQWPQLLLSLSRLDWRSPVKL